MKVVMGSLGRAKLPKGGVGERGGIRDNINNIRWREKMSYGTLDGNSVAHNISSQCPCPGQKVMVPSTFLTMSLGTSGACVQISTLSVITQLYHLCVNSLYHLHNFF
jgi:hypothetical protein